MNLDKRSRHMRKSYNRRYSKTISTLILTPLMILYLFYYDIVFFINFRKSIPKLNVFNESTDYKIGFAPFTNTFEWALYVPNFSEFSNYIKSYFLMSHASKWKYRTVLGSLCCRSVNTLFLRKGWGYQVESNIKY